MASTTTGQENLETWRSLAIPFGRHMGIEASAVHEGRSEMRYEPLAEHRNTLGMVHGGAVMTLLDITLAAAARSLQIDSGVITIEMKASFMQPARGALVGRGRVMHRTKSMAFVEGTVEDAQGLPCAHATGTFKYVARKPAAPLLTD